MAENRQIGSVFARFGTLGAKNTVNTNVLGGSEAQNHSIYDVFLPLVAKSTVFTVVFGQHLAKTLVFTDVSPYNKMWFLDPKRTKIL